MKQIDLELPVVGVKFLQSFAGYEDVEQYHGVSYCDAVRLATFGTEQLLAPGSIEVCKWSPVVMALKAPENDYERSLKPRLPEQLAGVYLAPLWHFRGEPDVVVVRGRPMQLRQLAAGMGNGALQQRYRDSIGRSLLFEGERGPGLRAVVTQVTNRVLNKLKRSKRFDQMVKVAFRRDDVTAWFEKLLRNTVADMSVCRNSTVLPYLEDAGNISFFCTGGVTWGGNAPVHVTSGFPYRLFATVQDCVNYPGKPRGQ